MDDMFLRYSELAGGREPIGSLELAKLAIKISDWSVQTNPAGSA